MDEVVMIEVPNEPKFRDQLAKMLLGVAAGFIAGKVVEGAYDKFILNRKTNILSN